MPEKLNYSVRSYDGVKAIEFVGNLSAGTAMEFETVVKLISEKESLMINMVNIRMITSAGLKALVNVSIHAKQEFGTRVIILWPSEDLLSMAESADVYEYLIFAESIEEGQTKIEHFT